MTQVQTVQKFPLPDWFVGNHHDSIDSTNEEAKRLAKAGAPEGTFVIAGEQRSGRGRGDREWVSPAGNLYTSLLLRRVGTPTNGALYSFCAALAVADAIAQLNIDLSVGLKWPNDVLVNGQKISGILLESASGGDGLLEWLIIGVGINVAHKPDLPGLTVTSLRDKGVIVDLQVFGKFYAQALSNWIETFRRDGFSTIRGAWLTRAHGIGQLINARLSNRTYAGIFRGIDENGALILEERNGNTRLVTSGEVFF